MSDFVEFTLDSVRRWFYIQISQQPGPCFSKRKGNLFNSGAEWKGLAKL
jgi:hypothetical protein